MMTIARIGVGLALLLSVVVAATGLRRTSPRGRGPRRCSSARAIAVPRGRCSARAASPSASASGGATSALRRLVLEGAPAVLELGYGG